MIFYTWYIRNIEYLLCKSYPPNKTI